MVFGGSAFLQLPLTSDHAAFRLFLDAASTDDLGDPATDLGGAIATAARVFEHEGERGHRAILVVSDGESAEGGMEDALAELRKAEIPVFGIGIGTAQGGPIPADSTELPDRFHRDHIGRIAISRLEEGEMRHAAEATGRTFARWDNREERARLSEAMRKLKAGLLSTKKSPERADRFQWPLALAVIALLADLALATVRRRRLVAAVTVDGRGGAERLRRDGGMEGGAPLCRRRLRRLLGGVREGARRRQHPPPGLQSGERALSDASLRGRGETVSAGGGGTSGPSAAELVQPRATRLCARPRTRPSVPSSCTARSGRTRRHCGSTRPMPTRSGISSSPLRRLRDDRRSGGSPGRTRQADYGRGNMNSSGYEGNPDAAVGAMAGGGYGSAEGESAEELDVEQARRLLEAVQREQLQTHEGRRNKDPRSNDRDW